MKVRVQKAKAKKVRSAQSANEFAQLAGGGLSLTSLCVVEDWLSTRCGFLDWAISGKTEGGGIPVGRITECYGGTSTGKTLIAMELAISAQQRGFDVLYYDTETAFHRGLFERLGGDPDAVVYRTPDTVEELFDDLDRILKLREQHKRNMPMLIVWDSVAASSATEEMEKDLSEHTSPALHARAISKAWRKLTRRIPKYKICMFIVNQTRSRIGSYIKEDTTFGGKAIGFYSSVRIELRVIGKQIERIKGSRKRVVGINVRATIKKNKVAIPFREATFPIIFNSGIDNITAMRDMVEDFGLTTGGSWKTINIDGKPVKYQGKDWESRVWKPYSAKVIKMIDEAALLEDL